MLPGYGADKNVAADDSTDGGRGMPVCFLREVGETSNPSSGVSWTTREGRVVERDVLIAPMAVVVHNHRPSHPYNVGTEHRREGYRGGCYSVSRMAVVFRP